MSLSLLSLYLLLCRIDGEKRRLDHKHEAEAQWILKQQQWSRMEPKLPTDFDFEDGLFDQPLVAAGTSASATVPAGPVPGFSSGVDRSTRSSSPRRRKDEKMAENDPMRYCADRCVTTGNCDVFEDMFDLGPSEVIKFCTECVLSEDEEPCDIPESMFEIHDDESINNGPTPPSGMHP